MKLFAFITIAFFGLAEAQIVLHDSAIDWPQNNNTLGGALFGLSYGSLGSGSCIVQLPEMVNLFHVVNGFIVPDDSSPAEGMYKISAPMHWNFANQTFRVLLIFARGAIFNLTDIDFTCDPSDVADINVYSFPQNNQMGEASSTVCFRPAFHQGDVLTITLPVPVKRFNITTGDSELEVSNEGNMIYTVTGFKAPFGNDHNTEISFSLDYNDIEGVNNWFSAADVTVRVDRAPTPEALIN